MSKILFQGYLKLNKTNQYISVCGASEELPLLLYLHGGPGDAALPMIEKYNNSLADHFMVVVWEQRGCGKSYYPFSDEEEVSIGVFMEDLKELTEILLKKYNRKTLYLAGHSWGSVLGLTFSQKYPEYVTAYIGIGQVVNMKNSARLAYEFALKKAAECNDIKALKKLKEADCTYSSANWLKDLLYITKKVVHYKGSLHNHSSYSPLVKTVIFSKAYTLREKLNHQKGSLQSIQRCWPELMNVNFDKCLSFQVPIVLIEGRHDNHVSSELAWHYYNEITSAKSFYWFENSGHFPQWSEPDKFTEVLREIHQALKKSDC